jgi:hypothetical protein
MSNVLSDEKLQQVLSSAGAGGVAAAADRGLDGGPSGDGEHLPEGGRGGGAWPRRPSAGVKAGHRGGEVSTGSAAKAGVSTDPDALPGRSPGASACGPFRELIDAGLSRGWNAMSTWHGRDGAKVKRAQFGRDPPGVWNGSRSTSRAERCCSDMYFDLSTRSPCWPGWRRACLRPSGRNPSEARSCSGRWDTPCGSSGCASGLGRSGLVVAEGLSAEDSGGPKCPGACRSVEGEAVLRRAQRLVVGEGPSLERREPDLPLWYRRRSLARHC